MRERKWNASLVFPLLEQKVEQRESSNTFCERHGMSKSTYFYWHRRWKQSKSESPSGFVPVQVGSDQSIIVLELHEGLRVRLYPHQLPAVLSALGYAG
jgi:transposase-like protein